MKLMGCPFYCSRSEPRAVLLRITWQACRLELGYESTLEEARPEGQVQTVLSKVKGSC